jgi:hypothetical protein
MGTVKLLEGCMGKSVERIDKQDALKVIKNAKSSVNKSVEEFYFISGDKNTIKQLPSTQQKEIQGYIGNKSVKIILWRN